MQAITTKYVGPTNFRGSRVVAKCEAKRIFVDWDDSLDSEENHNAAAKKLAALLQWEGRWVAGGLPDTSGNCYVCVDGCFQDQQFVIGKAEAK